MSYDSDSDQPDSSAQNTFMARLRHELITPINIVVGYSSLLLEDLKESSVEEDVRLKNGLQQVRADGQQLFSLIKTILPPDQPVDSVNLDGVGHTLQAELLRPLTALIDCCQQLLNQSTPDLAPDLGKIHAAAQSLLVLIHNMATG